MCATVRAYTRTVQSPESTECLVERCVLKRWLRKHKAAPLGGTLGQQAAGARVFTLTHVALLYVRFATPVLQGNLSNFSHVGGLVCGLLVSFVILPNKRLDLWQRVLPWLGALGVVVWFTVLPPYTYHHVFPRMDCSPFS